jgi:type IV pilus assembly protein PilE
MAHHPTPNPATRHQAGFTLIELLITIIVLGVLVAVAFPTMMESVRKGRRSEAVAALAAMQQAQERWRSNNPNYSTTLSDLGLTSATTRSGYYTLQATAASASAPLATGYALTADGSGSTQANDGQCGKLSVQVVGGEVKYASCKSCSTFTYSLADACWSR